MNNYFKKYLKYKNKYLKLKNQNGGAIPKFIIHPDDITYIRNNLLNKATEFCGVFTFTALANNVIGLEIDKSLITTGQTDGIRDWCMQPIDNKLIWHSHPTVSRGLNNTGQDRGPAGAYPSVEDILKVLKHDNELSILFVNEGYWIIFKQGIFADWNNPQIRQIIEYYSQELIKHNNGKTLTRDRITIFVTKINEKLTQPTGLNIGFQYY